MPKLPSAQLARVELEGDYAGFWLVVRADPPMRVFEALQSNRVSEVLDALALITTSSNLVDEQERPVDLCTKDGWGLMAKDFVEHAAEKVTEIWRLPLASRRDFSPSSGGTPTTPPTNTA